VAADRRVAAIVQRVVRHVVGVEVTPDVVVGPRDERVDLDQAELLVVLDDARAGALGGLVAADRRDPGVEADQRVLQRHDLAQLAAAIRIALPETRAVRAGLLLDGLDGSHAADRDPVASFEFCHSS
jgi:hypothetical protein